jgi:ribosomal-protein-alanine N-acetyltransferase
MSSLTIPAQLDGPRLRLRRFTQGHINASYIGWLNDPKVVKYSNQRFTSHNQETCLHYLQSFADTPNRFYAIEDRAVGQLMGTLTIYANLQHQTADIGILIGPTQHWGQGFGQEAFELVIRALASTGQIRKVTAGTMACNLGMVKIMERAGLHLEATRNAQELLDGHPVDILYFAKFINTDARTVDIATRKL